MKKYEMPNIEVMTFTAEDIVTTSNWQESPPGEDD